MYQSQGEITDPPRLFMLSMSSTASPLYSSAFISNIPAGCPDDLLESILNVFGPVKQWRRLAEPSGALKPCGFVDFVEEPSVTDSSSPSYKSLSNCVRILPLVEIYHGGKRLLIKYDDKIELPVMEDGGEEGECTGSKRRSADFLMLDALIMIFMERRMAHAVESCRSLKENYEQLITMNGTLTEQAPEDEKEYAEAEARWSRREADIFTEYREYLKRQLVQGTNEGEENAVRKYQKDPQKFMHENRDIEHDKRVKEIAGRLPRQFADIDSGLVKWDRIDVDHLTRWLLTSPSSCLDLTSARLVIDGLFKRLSPSEHAKFLSENGAMISLRQDPEAFLLRLYGWLILNSNL